MKTKSARREQFLLNAKADPRVADAAGGRLAMALVRLEDLVDVGAVTRHPKNPREGDVAGIRESIRAHGVYRRIVVQHSTPSGELRMRVIAGNHTHEAAIAEGYKMLPMEFVICTDDEAERILLVDNALGDRATNNDERLAELLSSLASTPVGLAGSGYSQDDLDGLLADLQGAALPSGEPQAEPMLRSDVLIEIRCSAEDLREFSPTLDEWSQRASVTVDVS